MNGPFVRIDTRSRGRGDLIEAVTATPAPQDVAFAVVILLTLAAITAPLAILVRRRRNTTKPPPPMQSDQVGLAGNDLSAEPNAADDPRLAQMLTEARAQYDVWPSAYLEGVVSALHETLHDTPFETGRRDDDQAANAPGRSPHDRVRDYLLGRHATLAWMLGEQTEPPIQPILTKPNTPPRPPHDDAD